MGIPRQLQARLDQYDAQKQQSAGAGTPTSTDSPADAGAMPTGADAGNNGSTGDTGPTDGVQPDASHADDSVEHEATGADSSASPDTAASDLGWRRTEGRYKAQVKRLEDRISELSEHARGTAVIADLLQQTRAELAELRAGKVAPKAGEQTDAAPTELTDEEREMFGEFLPVAEKIIARTSAPLRAKIDDLERQTGAVGQRAMQTDEQVFVNRVRGKVPAFDSIINDPQWVDYTKSRVPLTSMTLLDALQDAHNARDLDRVTDILNAFASTRVRDPAAAGKPQTPTSAAASTATAGVTQTTPSNATGLAQFATPERTAANPAGKPTPKFRQSDYQARMNDLRAKRITTTEFEQFDKQFQEARRAGLVA
ncbi:hypothetical protein [Paraburkholderia domus]|uniref:Uncharacterized protein n=1 Tax=Paraburkholderia domus TaxID=2793075 RepID=A0A9N8N6S6_9BURK|nr:hypothetical protein [Paraburkholderia domus]MBK5162767.1 hypothetical protein [Burkholderia sp. R-70211]CAE6958727.1 hypothetical protein R70211_06778 [Paraburkholderia domus]